MGLWNFGSYGVIWRVFLDTLLCLETLYLKFSRVYVWKGMDVCYKLKGTGFGRYGFMRKTVDIASLKTCVLNLPVFIARHFAWMFSFYV